MFRSVVWVFPSLAYGKRAVFSVGRFRFWVLDCADGQESGSIEGGAFREISRCGLMQARREVGKGKRLEMELKVHPNG